MHGHMAFFGAYVMIVLAMITYARPDSSAATRRPASRRPGIWAFWLQMAGMFGMTMAFAAAGIAQTYLERILGLGYLETQLKIQVHFLMVLATGLLFTLGVGLFLVRLLLPRTRRSAAPTAWPAAAAEAPGLSLMTAQRLATLAAERRRTVVHDPGDGEEPFYLPVGDEVAVFEECHRRGLAVMLKGPTGCGKTRFVEHMAWRLERPLVTVACHDDLSASDLTGRWLSAAARPCGRTARSRAPRDWAPSATSTRWSRRARTWSS